MRAASPGFIAPKQTYSTDTGSCSGIAIVRDALYAVCPRGTRMYRAVISGSGRPNLQTHFNGTYDRLRTVEPAPGGNLRLTTTNKGGQGQRPGQQQREDLRGHARKMSVVSLILVGPGGPGVVP